MKTKGWQMLAVIGFGIIATPIVVVESTIEGVKRTYRTFKNCTKQAIVSGKEVYDEAGEIFKKKENE